MQPPSADPNVPANAPPAPCSEAEALACYQDLQGRHQKRLHQLRSRQTRTLALLGLVAAIIGVQTFASLRGGHSPYPLLVSFALLAVLILLLLRLQNRLAHLQRLVRFYDGCILRATGTQRYSERTGEDAAPPHPAHLYHHDLDITGSQSLFSLLATVRTGIGERGLARFLLEPAPREESILRQQAVRELLPQTELRERIALLGASSFQQLSGSFFDTWLEQPPAVFHPAFRYALGITTLAAIGMIAGGLLRLRDWSDLVPNLLAVLAVQAAIALYLRKRVLPLLEGGGRLQGQVRLFSEGLELLQNSTFSSAKLLELQRLSREPAGAVKLIKQLDAQLAVVEQRTKEWFFVFSLLTAAGTQAAMSIARWKLRHAAAMRVWLTAWAEFEALNALASYAFEHPPDGIHSAWPELLPPSTEPAFEAENLGHPLLPQGVRNDVRLNGETRFLLISGSNMAGKSTLLRSVGVNAVLAYAGAPVRASFLRLAPLTLGASIALTDSLAEGKSKFLAEVHRLAAIVAASESHPVLFLVDEIFSGTNSLDRYTAAAAVLTRLLANGAMGALSTHDLALTTLATESDIGLNVHMASSDPEDPLAFDYKLKSGVNQQTNALAIIRMMGL